MIFHGNVSFETCFSNKRSNLHGLAAESAVNAIQMVIHSKVSHDICVFFYQQPSCNPS